MNIENINKVEINYSKMKDSFYKILNTNYSSIAIRLHFYNNIFLLNKEDSFYSSKKKIPKVDIKVYNTYYTLLESIIDNCITPEHPDFLNNLYSESKYNIYNLVQDNVNIKKILESNKIENNLIDEVELLNIYNNLKNSNRQECMLFSENLSSILNYTYPVKYMLFLKIVVKYLNPNISNSKLTNENLPYLNILDLFDDITDNDKKILINIVKLKLIVKYEYPRFLRDFHKIPYVEMNKELINRIENNIKSLKNKFENFVENLNLDFNSIFITDLIFNKSDNLINNLIGNQRFRHKNKYFKEYIEFDNFYLEGNFLYRDDFDPSILDSINRYFAPFYLNCIPSIYCTVISERLDDFFTNIQEKKNIFNKIINSTNLDEIKELKLKLFNFGKIMKLDFNIKHSYNIIKINTDKKPNIEELFKDDDEELKCSETQKKYESVLNISKQFYEKSVLFTSLNPYFFARPIQFSGYGVETGFNTGPTKDVMYNLNELMNYIIKYDETSSLITYNTPKWIDNSEVFYTFLTHYLLTDLKNEVSKINFTFKYNMINTRIIELFDDKDFKKSLSYNKLFNKFINFLNIDSVKSLFYYQDDKPKYENIPENYEFYFFKICLFLIGDLFDGGNEYTYIKNEDTRDLILDPDNDYITTKLETFKMPDGFFDKNSFDLFLKPINSIIEYKEKIEKTLIESFFIINANNIVSPELFISKIKFENPYDERYNIIFEYMKQIITNYKENLSEEIVNAIQEKYPTQQYFNDKLLLTWTSSLNIKSNTVINLGLIIEGEIQFSTCFNYMGFPIPSANYQEISYEDFVNNLLGILEGVGFGRSGGKKTKKKNKKHRENNKYSKKKINYIKLLRKNKVKKYKKLTKTLKK